MKLTPAGHLLAERASTTLDKIQNDLAQVRRLGRGEEGTLTVGFSGSVMFTSLPADIETFRRRYPKVELRLREPVTTKQIAALQEGTLDLALLRDADPTDGIHLATWLEEPYVAVLPESHPLARQRSLRVSDLRSEPFILFDRSMGPLAFDRTIACCEAHGFRPHIVQEASQWPTPARLVAAGLGVSLAPACVATVTFPGAVCRQIRDAAPTTVDLGVKEGVTNTLADNFIGIVKGTGAAARPSKAVSAESPRASTR